MICVSGSGGCFCRDVHADEARQPAGDDGEWPINAHGASLLSHTRTRTPAVKRDEIGNFGVKSTEEEAWLPGVESGILWL